MEHRRWPPLGLIAGQLDAFRRELTERFPLVNTHPDVAGVLRQPDLLAGLGPALAAPFRDAGVTLVAAPEARGPILGALTATALDAGLVLVRKEGANHPGADRRLTTRPTWKGEAQHFQMRSFDLGPHDRVLVVDDWITTGNSTRAVRDLTIEAGATYVGASVLVNKAARATLEDFAVAWLVTFDDLGDGLPAR